MKILRILLGTPLICIVVLSAGTQFTSCKKTVTVHDTTVVTIHDTTVRTVIDSIYDMTNGLVAYYNFNNGNLNDSSGNDTILFLIMLPQRQIVLESQIMLFCLMVSPAICVSQIQLHLVRVV